MSYEISQSWRNKGGYVCVNLPLSRIAAMPPVPSRFKVNLLDATQEQMALLKLLGHPAINEVKKEPEKKIDKKETK